VVEVERVRGLYTGGIQSNGIEAQSIGGGGGEGGRAVGLIAVGGSGGVSGDGGIVQVTNDAAGQITVAGAMSSGVFAQSIGGGGGDASGGGTRPLIGFAARGAGCRGSLARGGAPRLRTSAADPTPAPPPPGRS